MTLPVGLRILFSVWQLVMRSVGQSAPTYFLSSGLLLEKELITNNCLFIINQRGRELLPDCISVRPCMNLHCEIKTDEAAQIIYNVLNK